MTDEQIGVGVKLCDQFPDGRVFNEQINDFITTADARDEVSARYLPRVERQIEDVALRAHQFRRSVLRW